MKDLPVINYATARGWLKNLGFNVSDKYFPQYVKTITFLVNHEQISVEGITVQMVLETFWSKIPNALKMAALGFNPNEANFGKYLEIYTSLRKNVVSNDISMRIILGIFAQENNKES